MGVHLGNNIVGFDGEFLEKRKGRTRLRVAGVELVQNRSVS